MENVETISNGDIWNAAAKTGLVFAAVTIACSLLKQGVAAMGAPTFVTYLLNGVLWAAEFLGCIWLMIFFMKKMVRDYSGVTNFDTRRYGRRIALFSAILIATVNYLILHFMPEEKLQENIDQILSAYGTMLDSNTLSMMNDMMQDLPLITFVSNLIYCYLYGSILSAILSRGIPAPDPFAGIPPANES